LVTAASRRRTSATGRGLGLRTADKPAAACLSSRIPYGTPVTVGTLTSVAEAEAACEALAFLRCGSGTTVRWRASRSLPRTLPAHSNVGRDRRSCARSRYTYVSLDSRDFGRQHEPHARPSIGIPIRDVIRIRSAGDTRVVAGSEEGSVTFRQSKAVPEPRKLR